VWGKGQRVSISDIIFNRKIAIYGYEMKPHKEEAKKSPERPPTLNQMIKADVGTLT